MVNWNRDFPNLTNENRKKLRTKFNRARSDRQREAVLRSAQELDIKRTLNKAGANSSGVIRFPNSNTSSTLRQRRAAVARSETRKKVVNAAKRTAKRTANTVRRMAPSPERVLDMGWRMGKMVYDNPRGVEMFMEIMVLLLRPDLTKTITSLARRALPPLNLSKESTSERLERVYGLSSAFIGDVVKFDALLHSNEVTSTVEASLFYLFMCAIVLRLLVIGSEKSRKMVTDVLDGVVSIIRLPGYTGFLSIDTMLKSIVAMHVQLLLVKITDVYASKLLPAFVRTMIKNLVQWVKSKFNLNKFLGPAGKKMLQVLLSAIIDMKYAPKSIVRQSVKLLAMTKTVPTQSIAPGTVTPNASRNNNNERVAESPGRPTRRRATVTGEGVSPMRIRASGSNGKRYIFSQSIWNSMNRNGRTIATTSTDPVVRLTYKNQVRYARRSEL
jgi:hypothetical protein